MHPYFMFMYITKLMRAKLDKTAIEFCLNLLDNIKMINLSHKTLV